MIVGDTFKPTGVWAQPPLSEIPPEGCNVRIRADGKVACERFMMPGDPLPITVGNQTLPPSPPRDGARWLELNLVLAFGGGGGGGG